MSLLTLESELGQKLLNSRLIAVLVIDRVEDAVPIAESLLEGGVDVMELTLRTPVAMEALIRIREAVPEMTAGLGTILDRDQVDAAIEAGAAFGVSPAVNPLVLDHARVCGLPFGPGVMTPSDVDTALVKHDCHFMKFFPATSSGGLDHLKNIAAPYAHLGVKFIPLGGINLGNLAEWLDSDLVGAVGGSWLAPRDVIAEGSWGEIRERAKEARGRL
ncbi:MAG: bifunctional 4-hydroxy-2-oxoglutarate aldolase/2-dehydro-3-deoxy-phosphogluconate aldolase [Verrucomicrobiota bacterium]